MKLAIIPTNHTKDVKRFWTVNVQHKTYQQTNILWGVVRLDRKVWDFIGFLQLIKEIF